MADQIIITIFKALADPTRLDIVRKLASQKNCASCQEVSHISSLSQPALSHHFTKLVEAGVVLEQKRGKQKFYELNTELLEAKGINPSLL